VDALTWENLAYQPYFSVTGANVAYGMWSHDIEGPPEDNELYTRWIQWASVSAVVLRLFSLTLLVTPVMFRLFCVIF
jgi:alpha-glucosidase (family GH31 glycosyl hydrolase)